MLSAKRPDDRGAVATQGRSKGDLDERCLPLLSAGGSSMLATFLAIGLLQSINAQARETAAGKGRATIFE
jgi:hypothetical protein